MVILLRQPLTIIGGGLIGSIPALIGIISGQLSLTDVSVNTDFFLHAIALTFVIVAWEELWFRGIILNYCNRYLSAITISLIVGFLFMVVHMLNPKIDLLRAGPTLFFAGALLTILYFYFKTIWVPVGLHFGNNYLQSVMHPRWEDHSLFGQDGYIAAATLAVLFFIFVVMTINRQRRSKAGAVLY